jgi:hypothetical protein
MTPEHQELLRRLVLNDEATVASATSGGLVEVEPLDERTSVLAHLAALIAIGSDVCSYQSIMDAARAAGASSDEIPKVGNPRNVHTLSFRAK